MHRNRDKMSERTIRKIMSENSYSLLFVKGMDSSNNDFSVYLLMKTSLIAKFEKDYSNSTVCLDDYGKVIFGLSGNDVDEATEQKVLNLFQTQYLKN